MVLGNHPIRVRLHKTRRATMTFQEKVKHYIAEYVEVHISTKDDTLSRLSYRQNQEVQGRIVKDSLLSVIFTSPSKECTQKIACW